MIDVTLSEVCIAKFSKEIAEKIVEPNLQKYLDPKNQKQWGLAKYEIDFYNYVRQKALSFLRMKPDEIEAEFKRLLEDHLEQVVYASGSFPKIRRHLAESDPKIDIFRREWAEHEKSLASSKTNAKKGPKKSKRRACKCQFCRVSTNARAIFKWDAFSRKSDQGGVANGAAEFVKDVGFVVCPYCSRNYIAPISDGDSDFYRPDLDHFLAKSIYPYFSLCIYNLIPSCSACNCRIKGDVDFMNEGYFHPYQDVVPEGLFSLKGPQLLEGEKVDPNSVEIYLNTTANEKARKSADFFKLRSAYQIHKTEICDFVSSLRLIPDQLLEERAKLLSISVDTLKMTIGRSSKHDLLTYRSRPLGKLMRDIYHFTTVRTTKI